MELQINRLETRIEKLREMLNKDLEETTKSQLIIYNAITEIKNTLEGTKINEKEMKLQQKSAKVKACSLRR